MAEGDGFDDVFYTASDGLKLHARVYGDGHFGSWPVVCLPGLTRNARDFHELALFLSTHAKTPRKVVAFDYRGRGLSDRDRHWKNYALGIETADIVAGLTALGIEHAAFIGTSRGGLILHLMTSVRPAAIKAVVLNDIGPVVEGEGLAHIRAYLEGAPTPTSMADAVAIQRATHGPAFSALSNAEWERMTAALYRLENGRPVADFDRKLVKTLAAMDLSSPMATLWPQFDGFGSVPLMVIRGANSKLLSAATVEEMARRHAGMVAVTVAGQGHPPMLDTGDLPERIAGFIDQAEASAGREAG